MNGDNPLSTSAVSSCTYGGNGNPSFLSLPGTSYVEIDSFEFTGVCFQFSASSGNQPPYGTDGYLSVGYSGTGQGNNIFTNLYFHGWTHKTFNCSYNGGLVGVCDYPLAIQNDGHQTYGGGDIWDHIDCDGSDSDATSFGCFFGEAYILQYSTIRYNAQGLVTNNTHILHDTLIEYISESSDGVKHSNAFEFNSEWEGSNQVYNILMANNTTAVTGWVCPNGTDYYYNNVVSSATQQPWDFDTSCSGSGIFYNNTFADGGSCIGNGGSNWPGTFVNTLFINQSICNTATGGNTDAITLTDAQATASGLTATSNYNPASAACNGNSSCPAGAGQNLTSYCGAIGAALCSSTTAGDIATAVARPATGAWDVGAYVFQGASPVQPPTSLTATIE